MKTGLVLEGGGMRGLFTEGVIDVMMEHGVDVDGIIGVSAGALFGCNFKSRQIGRGLRYNLRFKGDPRYMGVRSFLKTGNYVSAEFAYHVMPTQLDVFDMDAFNAHPAEFYVVCTDIDTGEPVYKLIDHADDTALEWFRATGSMPLVSTPVELEGKKLLDGGMVDCVPLKFFQSKGYKRNIVILTQPDGYQKKPSSMSFLFKMAYRKHPKVGEAMSRRHIMYNNQLSFVKAEAEKGDTLLIFPDDKLDIGRTEQSAEKMKRVYELGRKKGEEMIEKIKAFVAK